MRLAKERPKSTLCGKDRSRDREASKATREAIIEGKVGGFLPLPLASVTWFKGKDTHPKTGPARVCPHRMNTSKDRTCYFIDIPFCSGSFLHDWTQTSCPGQNISSELMYLEVSHPEVQNVLLSLTDDVNFNCKIKTPSGF